MRKWLDLFWACGTLLLVGSLSLPGCSTNDCDPLAPRGCDNGKLRTCDSTNNHWSFSDEVNHVIVLKECKYSTCVERPGQGAECVPSGTTACSAEAPFVDAADQVVVGDVNGDGESDAIVLVRATVPGRKTPAGVHVLLGDAHGNLTRGASLDVPNPARVATGDVNGDGRGDLVVLTRPNGGATTSLLVFFASSTPGFDAPWTTEVPAASVLFSVADTNGDGRADVVTGADGEVVVLLSGSERAWMTRLSSAVEAPLGPQEFAQPFSLVDVDGDARLDLVYPSAVTGKVHTHLGRGDGSFATATKSATFACHPYVRVVVTAADFDGDKHPDLAVACGAAVSVYRGTVDGSFGEPQRTSAPDVITSWVAADVDGDGRPDLIASYYETLMIVFRGKGDFSFELGIPSSPTLAAALVQAAIDGDHDGHFDVVVTDAKGAQVVHDACE